MIAESEEKRRKYSQVDFLVENKIASSDENENMQRRTFL